MFKLTFDACRSRIQLTSDRQASYLGAVEDAFGNDIDFAQLVKMYGEAPGPKGRYSLPICTGARKRSVTGKARPALRFHAYAERQNLTIRMQVRRFTRLTNAFSEKIENHACAVALHFMYYNFVRIYSSL